MAARYWVTGGTGNTNSTTNWSTTSGGASGASVPVLTDDAIFDGNSGVGTVNVNAALDVLSIDFNAFNGTLAFNQTIRLNGGNITFGAGMTITGTANLVFLGNCTLTSNGKEIYGSLQFVTGFPSGGTLNLSGDFKCGAVLHNNLSGIVNIDGSDLYLKGGATAFTTTAGRTLQGTSTIRLVATTASLTISHTGTIKNNVVINATNTITQTATVNIGGGTWTYTAGTWNTGTSAFVISGDCTLNLAGMTIYRLTTGAAATCTLTSLLTVAVDIQYSLASGFIFAGTHGFTCATLTDNATSTARAITLAAGVEYFVTSSLYLQSGWTGSRASIVSGTPGTKAKLNITQSVTQFLPNCNFTDIEATNYTVWTYNGTISNCTNVRELNHKQPTIGTAN